MSAPRLPEHLEPLLTDEPVLDVYAFGPWRVPGGLYEELRERAEELNRDPRATALDRRLSEFYGPDTSVAGAELWSLLTFLLGASALRGGSRGDVDYEVLGAFLATPEPPVRDPLGWFTQGGRWRPPGLWVPEAAAAPEHRDVMYDLVRACLDVFTDLEPVRERRAALAGLLDRRETDGALAEDAATAPRERLEEVWAAAVPDELLPVLPELAGPVGYLGWVCSGFTAAHERLTAAIGDGLSLDTGTAAVLLAAEVAGPPAELAPALGTARYENLADRMRALREGFAPDLWRHEVRGWLARGLVAGEADACRAWLDMAMRLTGAVQGVPETATSPRSRLPVRAFQHDLRRLFDHRPVANPLAERLATARPATAEPTEPDEPDETAEGEEEGPDDLVGDTLVGQPDLAAALQDGLAARIAGRRPLRLMVAGPEGTGKGTAVGIAERRLVERGALREALWISDQVFAALSVSDAALWLQARARDCLEGRMLMVIEDVERLASYERCGPAAVEELRRIMARSPALDVVALCRPGGDARLLETNPALVRSFTVTRTRELAEPDLAELFRRAVTARGARVSREVARAAGAQIGRTPAALNLRGARLVEHLAEVSAAAALERGDRAEVLVSDLPERRRTGTAGADPLDRLDAMAGIEPVKREVRALVAEAKAAHLRRKAGMPASGRPRHLVFTGNPGTGKSEVARILGAAYADRRALSTGHLVEADRADLVGEFSSESAVKVRRAVERALGGVLLVRDAHTLAGGTGGTGGMEPGRAQDTLDVLLAAVQSHPEDLAVVLTGPTAELNGLLKSRPGLAAAFPRTVPFPDLDEAELLAVFESKAAAAGFTLAPGVRDRVTALMRAAARERGFTNGRWVANLLDRAVSMQGRRVLDDDVVDDDESLDELLPVDVPGTLAHDRDALPGDPLGEVERLIGLEEIKREVARLAAEAEAEPIRYEAGLPAGYPSRHMVFTGNPGTAKTTIARLVAAVYAQLGLLSSGHLVEVTRADLVAEYVGQTAHRVRASVDRALGGVLFIDEAYALSMPGADQRDFGHEAVAELLRLMEEHRADLVVIVAGYDAEMEAFLRSNPGLRSRFPKSLRFPDYSDDELVAIFESMAAEAGFEPAPDLPAALRRRLAAEPRGDSFGNARLVRNLLEAAMSRQAQRITSAEPPGGPDPAEVRSLRAEDLPDAAPGEPSRAPGAYL